MYILTHDDCSDKEKLMYVFFTPQDIAQVNPLYIHVGKASGSGEEYIKIQGVPGLQFYRGYSDLFGISTVKTEYMKNIEIML